LVASVYYIRYVVHVRCLRLLITDVVVVTLRSAVVAVYRCCTRLFAFRWFICCSLSFVRLRLFGLRLLFVPFPFALLVTDVVVVVDAFGSICCWFVRVVTLRLRFALRSRWLFVVYVYVYVAHVVVVTVVGFVLLF